MELVDHHGATFVVFFLAIVELMAFCWIYGVKRLCDDVYFMLGYRPNIIWRMCWQFVTPIVMIVIFIYSLISLKPVTYNGYVYKDSHYGECCPSIIDLIDLTVFFSFYSNWMVYYSFRPQSAPDLGDSFLLQARKGSELYATLLENV